MEHVRPTSEKKILLLLDNHESHKYYPALDYASKNNIVILSLAPHTTHKMQPIDVAVYGPLKRYFEREVNAFQKSHPGRIINQYDVARLLSPAFLKCAVAINAVHGFEKPGIWPVNKYAFGEEDYEPSAVIAGTSNMNVGTESANSPERMDIPGAFAETSSTPSPSLLQEFNLEIIPSPNRATPSELEAFIASITDSFKIPKNISSEVGCTPEKDPGCFQIVSAVELDVATNGQEIDTILPETEENIQRNTSRNKSPVREPGCSTSHYSPLVLRPIPNPPKPMTARKRKLQRSEILTSTPIKEDQKQKFEKNKVKKVSKRLDDKSTNVPVQTVSKKTKTDKNKK